MPASDLTVAVFGDFVVDRVHRLRAPYRRHTANTAATQLVPGGAGTHMTCLFARLGITVRALGRIGADPEGRWLVERLAHDGVDVSYLRQTGRTGVVTVLVEPDGERTLLLEADQDARTYTLTDVLDVAAVSAVDAVHVSGHSLIRDTDTAAAAARIAAVRADGIHTSVEVPDVPSLERFGVDRFRRMIETASLDLVFADAVEATALGIREGWLPRGSCVVTAGADPVTVTSARGTTTAPVAPVDAVVDTTGAGDVFAAAFLAAALDRADTATAVARAHTAASRFISSARI